ncbi:MAG TPA: CHC2 zinc finger domain-containing protein, partial [Pyrinomonadaceae bacterium]|nr:CHC2 zinc finger domain-containing protein [Pyrinomonadaceae bacterium]
MKRERETPERLRELRDEIKRRVDYRAFFMRYVSGEVRPSGARFHALCPIPSHEHTGKGSPSLSVDVQRGLFHCFSRGEGGDAITFYELMHGVSFSKAVREMARELGLGPFKNQRPSLALRAAPDAETPEAETFAPLDPQRTSELCEKFLEACRVEDQAEGLGYLARRGIDPKTAHRAGVAYFPRRAYRRVMRRMRESFPLEELRRGGLFNARAHLTFYRHRLLFPFRVEGRARYLQARTTAPGVEPRWHNMRGTVPALYNVDSLAELTSDAVV